MKTNLNIILIFITSILAPIVVTAGPGHSHDDEATTNHFEQTPYHSTEAFSDKYELLLRYEPILPGMETKLTLFISDYETNKPVNDAEIKIVAQEDSGILFSIHQDGPGTYAVSTLFPEQMEYSLAVHLEGPAGPDLLLLDHVEVGIDEVEEHESSVAHFIEHNIWLLIVFALVFGLIIGLLLRRGGARKTPTVIVVFTVFACALPSQTMNAHGGDDHGGENASGNFSTSVPIPKETQFLFDIYTQKLVKGSFQESSHLFGTIFPSSNGQALISSDQSGTISHINVQVGQEVNKGHVLATVKKTIDLGTQMSLQAEANILQAEYDAARKEMDRLNTIRDIAAHREIDEAISRLQKAETNLALFNSKSGETITLTAPISGVVGSFKLSIGTTVAHGQILFTVTDLSLLYVEAQVFDRDANRILPDATYTMECVNDKDKHVSSDVKLLSRALEINATNQTQKVLFEVANPNGDFKIGEFVNIRVFDLKSSQHITVPNSAITEINGKPVVFVKESAEEFSVSYVQLGHNNGTHTSIVKGLEEGERVAINGSYQLKMIFLNQ